MIPHISGAWSKQIHKDRKNGGFQGLRGREDGSYCSMDTISVWADDKSSGDGWW